jgi:hypothetical protein
MAGLARPVRMVLKLSATLATVFCMRASCRIQRDNVTTPPQEGAERASQIRSFKQHNGPGAPHAVCWEAFQRLYF